MSNGDSRRDFHVMTYNRLADEILQGMKGIDDMEKYLFSAIALIYTWLALTHDKVPSWRLVLLVPPVLILIFLSRVVRQNRRIFARAQYMASVEKLILDQSQAPIGFQTLQLQKHTEKKSAAHSWASRWLSALALKTWSVGLVLTLIIFVWSFFA